MPPFYKQVLSFVEEMWIAVKFRLSNKYIKVDSAIQQQRWNVCQSCVFFQRGRCSKCGCFMKLKTQLASASCPENKWSATIITTDECEICPP